ncbi:hypothetical protein [Roseovarius nitratireducens]|uniref:hypothetical protein n=1 Tax=Roseovarius nitratireducens TaxID=2044597 RepID=UPI000CE26A8D|nr:hypothetical protein [Roseovarius nitratireducens]
MDIIGLSRATNLAMQSATKTELGWRLACSGSSALGKVVQEDLVRTYGPNGIQPSLYGGAVTVTHESPAYADIEELQAQRAAPEMVTTCAPAQAMAGGVISVSAIDNGTVTMTKHYLVAVCELDALGEIKGSHHLSSHTTGTPEEAKDLALSETAADWGWHSYGPDDLHVLFVLAVPFGTEIEVIEYNEKLED